VDDNNETARVREPRLDRKLAFLHPRPLELGSPRLSQCPSGAKMALLPKDGVAASEEDVKGEVLFVKTRKVPMNVDAPFDDGM